MKTAALRVLWLWLFVCGVLGFGQEPGGGGDGVLQTYRVFGLSEPARVEDLRECAAKIEELKLEEVDYEKGEVRVRLFPERLFKGKAESDPEAVLKRVNQLLGQASTGTFRVSAPSKIAPEKLQKIQIVVGLLDCKGCRFGAYRAVANLDGVEQVRVAVNPSLLTVWIDPEKTDKEALYAALRKARVEVPAE